VYSRCGYCNCPECQRRETYWYCQHLGWNICSECCAAIMSFEDKFVECDNCDMVVKELSEVMS
jgi:hypothetical protein